MKAVIALPPVLDFYFTPARSSALGARVLERELKEAGWTVKLMNLPMYGKAATLPLPDCLGYLKKYIISDETGPVSWFTSYHRFGPDPEEAAALIGDEAPDCVFISCFAWAYAEEALNLAVSLACRLGDVPIVIGGHGPTSLPEYFLKAIHPLHPEKRLFSLVVSGEMEGHLGRIMASLSGEDGHLDLTKLPVPETLRPVAGVSMVRAGRRSISISLTRGCPGRCSFCSNHLCHGRDFRCAPEALWDDEVAGIAEGHRTIHLNFEDDNIMLVRDHFRNFVERLSLKYPGITFTAENGLDYSLLSADDLTWMKEFRFLHLNLSLGVLSVSARIQTSRHGNPVHLEQLLRHAGRIGLKTTTHFISGIEGESPGDVTRTLIFLHNLPTRIGISSFYPVPGLPGFTGTGRFLAAPPRLAAGSSMYPWTGSLSTAQMLTAFRLARWSNFQKGLSGRETGSRLEKELMDTVLRQQCLSTITRKRGICPLPDLDDKMQKDFFACQE